ncbi:hypothetical protein KM043_005109 [Ampulex compressa]|nr:hypothetical protein KM043_005109 [Ampulex compressa]
MFPGPSSAGDGSGSTVKNLRNNGVARDEPRLAPVNFWIEPAPSYARSYSAVSIFKILEKSAACGRAAKILGVALLWRGERELAFLFQDSLPAASLDNFTRGRCTVLLAIGLIFQNGPIRSFGLELRYSERTMEIRSNREKV